MQKELQFDSLEFDLSPTPLLSTVYTQVQIE
jgi:hypothetical protein